MRFLYLAGPMALIIAISSGQPAIASIDDNATPEAVAQTLGNEFAKAFFIGDPQLALRHLHPALAKSGVQPNIRRSGRDGVLSLTPGILEIFAKQHNADGHLDANKAPVSVEVLDSGHEVVVFRLIAASDWFDYYLAAKINGKWKLINCVFGPVQHLENPSAAADEIAIRSRVESYALSLATGDFAAMRVSTHLDFTRRSISKGLPARLLVENAETLSQDIKATTTKASTPKVDVLGITQSTAAARISNGSLTEWVFMLKLDGVWIPVNSFWQQDPKAKA
jgi:Putative lumazine-binding